MGRKAIKVGEQIKRLIKRGMNLDLELENIENILLDIGYYRLGFYWHHFEVDSNHNLAKNTNFSDIVKLYYLDVEIRNILIKYLNRLELNFRTKVIYHVSNKYINSPCWFSEHSIMKNYFILKLDNYYNNEFKLHNKTIKAHHINYPRDNFAPAWKTLEYFSFGQLCKTYENLKDTELQKDIAKLYGYKSFSYFLNHMSNLVKLRNVCAHNGVLFDYNSSEGYTPFVSLNFNNGNIHSLDSNIKVLKHLIYAVDAKSAFKLDEEIKELFIHNRNDSFLKSIIENHINYKF